MASAEFIAVVTGATGAIGQFLVVELLKSPVWKEVRIIGRREWTPPPGTLASAAVESALRDGRLKQFTVTQEDYDAVEHVFDGADASFCIIGAPKHKTGSSEAYWRINKELPLLVGRLSREHGCKYMAHVSSVGASTSSWAPYLRIKGEVEAALTALAFPLGVALWRPGLLNRAHMTEGWQRIAVALLPSMPVQRVAAAMVQHAQGVLGRKGAAASPCYILTNADIP